VIRGSAVNNDGAGKIGFTAPGVEGQSAVIAEAQNVAGVDPGTITYVEAHGSGTPLGDTVEIRALTRAFRLGTGRTGFCALSSVKTSVGHCNEAAGIAGLIKTVLALDNRLIPPSLHVARPHPEIAFAETPFTVATQPAAWQMPAGLPRRAGVSSFGIGGTNAHAPAFRWGSSRRRWGSSRRRWGSRRSLGGSSRRPWGSSGRPWGLRRSPWGARRRLGDQGAACGDRGADRGD
jgi:acyl transferase domain-containing protein